MSCVRTGTHERLQEAAYSLNAFDVSATTMILQTRLVTLRQETASVLTTQQGDSVNCALTDSMATL